MKDHQWGSESQKKPYKAPVVHLEAKMPLVTAGSFDLILP